MKVRWSIVLLAAFGIVAALAAAVLTASLSAGQIQAVMPSAPKDVTILDHGKGGLGRGRASALLHGAGADYR